MSYSYERVERRRRTTAGGSSYGYSGSRSTFGYWVPLVLTVTAATVGLVAWVWSERKDDEEDSSGEEQYPGGVPPSGYGNMSGALPTGPGQGNLQPGPTGPGFPQGAPLGPGMGMPAPPGDGMGMPPQAGGFQGPPPGPGMGMPPLAGGFQQGGGEYARSTSVEQTAQNETTLVGRMSSALGMGRSSSPAQSYDWASKKVVAGVAAAGAMVGGALSSIREGSGDDFEDHERWSEEADGKDIKMGITRQGTADEFYSGAVELPKRISMPGRRRKTVAIVVSAVEVEAGSGEDVGHHASILSHLPEHVDPESTRIFVLIYAPDLKTHPLGAVATRRTSQSMASSFSNISQADAHTPAHTPGEFPTSRDGEDGILAQVDPNPIDDSTSLYKTLHNQAQALVDKDTMILPFTSRNGHKHLLKSLAPEVVYIHESLCGLDGQVATDLSGWVRQIVVVVGDEGGYGGLVDTEDEDDGGKETKWWQKEERTGVGRRVAVVESVKIGEDWKRRVAEVD